MVALVEKRALQVCVAAAAIVPVAAGAWGVVAGLGGASGDVASHQRYLSGLLMAIGFAFGTTLPGIEHKAARFRLLTGVVMTGGLCRLLGVVLGDGVSPSVGAALGMELVVIAGLCLWQSRVARARLALPWVGTLSGYLRCFDKLAGGPPMPWTMRGASPTTGYVRADPLEAPAVVLPPLRGP
jgi:hypothetical protein